MLDFESARRALAELRAWRDAHGEEWRNEASTRFHLIDVLLRDCLGWEPEDVSVEKHGPGGFTDYELGRPARQLVLEAKREGVTFELPSGWSQPTAPLSQLADDNPAIGEAIEQATRYAQGRGLPIAVVANGNQLIAFLASRSDGVAPSKGRAVVFSSLEDMEARFTELWDHLSKPGVGTRYLVATLQTAHLPPPPEKLSDRLPDYPGFKNRNPVAAELQILGGLFLEDILRYDEVEDQFLREAYCQSGALSQYALVGREILAARYSSLFESEAGVSLEAAADKHGRSDQMLQDALAAALSGRPIIILGDVGVGKTTFIRHFIKVDAVEVLRNSLVLYVDFGSRPALNSELQPYVTKEFARQLHEDYGIDVTERNFVRGVYHSELQTFSEGIYKDLREIDENLYRAKQIDFLEQKINDPEGHLKAAIEHIQRGRQRQVVVFLDNIDQRPGDFQEQVFLIAQSLASSWSLTCFVALRPETFYESRATGTLAAYQPRVFTVSPPRVERVILERLRFGRRQLAEVGRLPNFPEGMTLQSSSLDEYLSVLEDAFAHNEAIIEFVDNMSGGNVRQALDFVVAFVGSGHVASSRILDIFARQGHYTLPVHEFLRAVLYGDHQHYDPRDSPIANLFDTVSGDAREHFLLASLLAFVERVARVGKDDGYLPVQDLFGAGSALGFEPRQIDYAMQRAIRSGLLSATMAMDSEEESSGQLPTHVRITTAGAYALSRLIGSFQYVDAVIVDTPITDPDVRARISDARSIEERLDRAEIVLDYLDASWAPLRGVSLLDWDSLSAQCRADIGRIRGRVSQRSLNLGS